MGPLEERRVVTCFLRHRGEVLLLRRSDAVGSYRGKWGAVAGHAEGDPEAAAWREIEEETGLERAVRLVARGEPFVLEDETEGKRWVIHPFLFDCRRRAVRLDWESTEAEWVSPTEILRRDTVPELWTSYARVAPTRASIAADREHGSAYLSLRALEVLRDHAAIVSRDLDREGAWDECAAQARRLLRVRPSMAALIHRIHRVMHRARSERSAPAVEREARAEIERALAADESVSRQAGARVAGRRLLTLSRSGTVSDALRAARPAPDVLVAASLPGGEGIAVAEELFQWGLEVTLLPDAGVAAAVLEGRVELVLVGADTVLRSGAIVNKTGTLAAALAAARRGIPFYAAASRDKILADPSLDLETADPAETYAGSFPIKVMGARFEITPAELVTGIIDEEGILRPEEVAPIADELERLADW